MIIPSESERVSRHGHTCLGIPFETTVIPSEAEGPAFTV